VLISPYNEETEQAINISSNTCCIVFCYQKPARRL